MSDTAEREALATVIHEIFNACRGRNGVSPAALADVILAAGWGRAEEAEWQYSYVEKWADDSGVYERVTFDREAQARKYLRDNAEHVEGLNQEFNSEDQIVASIEKRVVHTPGEWVPVKQKVRVAPETVGVADHKAEEGSSDVPALDPQPWLFISDQVVGEIRSDHDKGYHGVSGTYWVFSPREGFEKDRARYDDANDVNGAKR